MMHPRNAAASALLLLLTSYSAVVDGYFTSADMVAETWNAQGSAVGQGNGAFMSPDGQTLAVISRDCSVVAYDPASGTSKWTHTPTGTVECLGGLWFAGSYVAYSAVTGQTR